ncbi:MAG: hypothetical protein LBN99_01020 [Oscillospiraceae bacterium]|jgi:hypothetical protein|nr:hypothetical protein [Oscillospiraceae bacterium]
MTRYIGNSGRFYRIDEEPVSPPNPVINDAASPLGRRLGGLFSGGLPFGLELADIALLLLFLFLYLESGDEEFLIILAFLAIGAFAK